MMDKIKTAIFVSGLPASGKTTVGKEISKQLGVPVIDKDDILEAMYDSLGVGNSIGAGN